MFIFDISDHREIVNFLIEKEANVVDAEQKNKWTPLHLATEYGNLLNFHFKIKQLSNLFVQISGQTEIAKMLIEKESNINAEDANKYTPLHMAAERGYLRNFAK